MNPNEMTMDQIDERLESISAEMEADGADIDALTREVESLEERKKSIIESAERRAEELSSVASAPITKTVREERDMAKEKKITIDSKEYRDAFYAYLAGTATEEQRTTLINVDGDGSSVNPDAIAIPKVLDDMIWDQIHTDHPILADINSVNSGVVIDVTRMTARTPHPAGKKDAAAGGSNTDYNFVEVSLSGKDFESYSELTYAAAKMSQGALEKFLAKEIADELGESLARDVFNQMKSDATNAQKVASTGDWYDDILSGLASATQAKHPVVYAPNSTYWAIVGHKGSDGHPVNIRETFSCDVKRDDAAPTVFVVDPGEFILNVVQGTMIESERIIKTHKIGVSGYLRAEGTMRKTNAVSYIE